MKTLKKTLCLVLAVVMVVGVLIIPANAADYDDAAEIDPDYLEAVEVMSAIKVLGGDAEAKTFRPADGLSRAEAAKIIAYMLIGPETDQLGTAECFDDVPTTHWANKYINYLSMLKIVDPENDDFHPEDKVTGYEFGKMVLVALKFDPADYTNNPAWVINVTSDVKTVYGDFPVKAAHLTDKPIRRDAAAQLALAGLMYTDTGAGTGKYEIVDKETEAYKDQFKGVVFDSKSDAIRAMATSYTGATQGTDYDVKEITDNSGSLAATNYNGLKVANSNSDAGVPTRAWTDKSGAVSTIASEAVKTFTTAMTEDEVFTAVGAAGITGSSASYIVMDEIWQDGAKLAEAESITSAPGQYQAVAGKDAGLSESVIIAKGDKSNAAGFGNGVTVSLYETGVANHYVMVAVRPFIAKIGEANTDGVAELTFMNTDATDNFTKHVKNANIGKDKMVLVTFDKDGVASIKEVAPVTAKVTRVSEADGTLTAGGTVYTYSQTYKAGTGVAVGKDVDLYLDDNGFLIYATEVEDDGPGTPVTGFAYFVKGDDVTEGELFESNVTNYARLLMPDGSTRDVVTSASCKSNSAGIVYYTVANGKYTLTTASVANHSELASVTNYSFTKGHVKLTVSGNTDSELTVSKDTVFFIKTGKGTDEKVTAYVGYANTPSFSTSDPTEGGKIKGFYVTTTKMAAAIFVDATADNKVTVGDKGTTSSTTAYILNNKNAPKTEEYLGEQARTYYTFTAIVNGEQTTLKIDADVVGSSGTLKALMNSTLADCFVTSLTIDEFGIVIGATDATSNFKKTGTVKVTSGLLGLGDSAANATWMPYTDDCVVYKINGSTITKTTVDKIETDADDICYIVDDEGTLITIYIQVKDAE